MAWFDHGEAHIWYEDAGGGDPLLLLPGWGGDLNEVAVVRAALETRFRVIAADLPGSGKSGPQPRTYTASYYADDAKVFLAMLNALGVAPAHVVGFSDGGEYALLMAALEPGTVRSVAAWGAAGSLGDNVMLADLFGSVIDNPAPPMAEFSGYLKATYGESNARIMTQSAAASFRAIIAAGGDISRSLAASITCPTLLITGENDFIAPPALVTDMAQAILSATYVEAAGASHSVHEQQPEWLVETITGWLASLSV